MRDDDVFKRHGGPPSPEYVSPSHDGGFFDEIQAHLESVLGPVSMVLHELVSDRVHVDVFEFAPTGDRRFYTYVTCGMSDLPMNAPNDLNSRELYQRAEVVISTPERATPDDWPILWLVWLARFPHLHKTWLWYGHSIPNGDPAKPLGTDTAMTGVVLGPVLTWPYGASVLMTRSGSPVCFLGVYPVHSDEMSLKLARDSDALFALLGPEGITEVLDRDRASVAGRAWLS